MFTFQTFGASYGDPRRVLLAGIGVVTIVAGGYVLASLAGSGNEQVGQRPRGYHPAMGETDAKVLARFGFADGGYRQNIVLSDRTADAGAVKKPGVIAAETIATLMSNGVQAEAYKEPSTPQVQTPLQNDASTRSARMAVTTVDTAVAFDSTHQLNRPAQKNKEVANLEAGTDRGGAPAAADAQTSSPIIQIELQRQRRAPIKAELPIDLDVSSTRNSRLLIGRVPAGVRFTKGQSAGLGLWQMRVAEFRGTHIIVEPQAPKSFQMTFMLLDTEGTVVNGLEIAFEQVDGKPQQPAVDSAPQAAPITNGEAPASAPAPGHGSAKRHASKSGAVQANPHTRRVLVSRSAKAEAKVREAKAHQQGAVGRPSFATNIAANGSVPMPVQASTPLLSLQTGSSPWQIKPWVPVQVFGWPQ